MLSIRLLADSNGTKGIFLFLFLFVFPVRSIKPSTLDIISSRETRLCIYRNLRSSRLTCLKSEMKSDMFFFVFLRKIAFYLRCNLQHVCKYKFRFESKVSSKVSVRGNDETRSPDVRLPSPTDKRKKMDRFFPKDQRVRSVPRSTPRYAADPYLEFTLLYVRITNITENTQLFTVSTPLSILVIFDKPPRYTIVFSPSH